MCTNSVICVYIFLIDENADTQCSFWPPSILYYNGTRFYNFYNYNAHKTRVKVYIAGFTVSFSFLFASMRYMG